MLNTRIGTRAGMSTHFHLDRSAGIAVLNEHSIDTYASQQTNQLLICPRHHS